MIQKLLTPLFVFCTVLMFGQSSNVATLKYDVIRQLNVDQLRPREGSQTEGEGAMPQVVTEERTIYFKDTIAYYKRMAGGGRMFRQMGGGGFKLPFDETSFIDMKNSMEITSLVLLNDSINESFFSVEPLLKSTEWKDTDKTKKILGFSCTKASVITQNGNYDVWYTKDAGFDFSPVPGILPLKGLVLKIEGDDLSYTAVSFDKKVEDLKPFDKLYQGTQISKEELLQKRRRAVGKLRPARQ